MMDIKNHKINIDVDDIEVDLDAACKYIYDFDSMTDDDGE